MTCVRETLKMMMNKMQCSNMDAVLKSKGERDGKDLLKVKSLQLSVTAMHQV